MPDFGTAREDFPGGDVGTLYRSIQRLLSPAPETRLCMCHGPGGRAVAWETTVAEQRAGHLPPPEDNGISHLKLPRNTL